jgi:hypothetical protein
MLEVWGQTTSVCQKMYIFFVRSLVPVPVDKPTTTGCCLINYQSVPINGIQATHSYSGVLQTECGTARRQMIVKIVESGNLRTLSDFEYPKPKN